MAPAQPGHGRIAWLNAKILHTLQNLIPASAPEKYNIAPKSAFTKHNQRLLNRTVDILNASFIRKEQFLAIDNLFSKAQ